MREGDILLAVNGDKVSTWTQARLEMSTLKAGSSIEFKVKTKDGSTKLVEVKPKKEICTTGTKGNP